MYRLIRSYSFEAAHMLPNHDGKCRRLHGHSYRMTIVVEGRSVIVSGPKKDMLIDYGDISKQTTSLLEDYLDHHYLNETTGLANPTSEALAEWIYWHLEPRFRDLGIMQNNRGQLQLVSVTIDETCTTSCTYIPDTVVESSGNGLLNRHKPVMAPIINTPRIRR